MNVVKKFDVTVNQTLAPLLKKQQIIKALVHMLLILYAARLAPSLPTEVLKLFDNQYFKLLVFSLILWTSQVSPSTSILIALAFMVTVNYMNKQPLWEFIENIEASATPIAPSAELALVASASVIESQAQQPPVVEIAAQKTEAIVVQPSVINTENGLAVVNPTVVVAPAIVSTPSGEKVLVTPEVLNVEVQKAPAVADAVTPAPAVEAAPAPAPAVAAPKEPASTPAPVEGCYPARHYDMNSVTPSDNGKDYQSWTA